MRQESLQRPMAKYGLRT